MTEGENTIVVKIFREAVSGALVPTYHGVLDAGADVYALEPIDVPPHQRAMVHTGIYMEIPEGYECQVRPRSGLALKHGITVLNTPGTIDASYRGECNVILMNHSDELYSVKQGDRIAQFVFSRHARALFMEVESREELSMSDRGQGGFGHSGK